MATYIRATYGSVSIDKYGFSRANIEIINQPILRSSIYKFDEETEEYDPLSLGVSLDTEFRKVSFKNMEIPIQYEKRPTLLVQKIYGDVDYTWIFLIFNGMAVYTEFTTGKIIKVPDKESLEAFLVGRRFLIKGIL